MLDKNLVYRKKFPKVAEGYFYSRVRKVDDKVIIGPADIEQGYTYYSLGGSCPDKASLEDIQPLYFSPYCSGGQTIPLYLEQKVYNENTGLTAPSVGILNGKKCFFQTTSQAASDYQTMAQVVDGGMVSLTLTTNALKTVIYKSIKWEQAKPGTYRIIFKKKV